MQNQEILKSGFLAWGAILLALGVVLGAMGAHALEAELSASQLDSFKTGVRYQVWMGLALLALPVIQHLSGKNLKWAMRLILIGVLFFSFSIYLLSLRPLMGMEGGLRFLGPVTPVGGLLMIVGWVLVFVTMLRKS
ncbi:DUF423 domain-containing protein [Halocola ammonii]